MERKGIIDPDLQEGIDCCLNCKGQVCELEIGKDKRKLPRGILYIRKQQIKQLYKDGLTIKEIAGKLGIHPRTVSRNVKRW